MAADKAGGIDVRKPTTQANQPQAKANRAESLPARNSIHSPEFLLATFISFLQPLTFLPSHQPLVTMPVNVPIEQGEEYPHHFIHILPDPDQFLDQHPLQAVDSLYLHRAQESHAAVTAGP